MTFDILLPFNQLNLTFLSLENRKEIIEKYSLLKIEVIQIFE